MLLPVDPQKRTAIRVAEATVIAAETRHMATPIHRICWSPPSTAFECCR
ncbi:MAG: hypothetical protein U1E38_01330 [Rhodospirillales bacterium]